MWATQRSKVLPLALCTALWGCGESTGDDNTQLPLIYAEMRGGMVFASLNMPGADGYDLYWTGVPAVPTSDRQLYLQLTNSSGHDYQPNMSPGGNGFVFARKDTGIFLVSSTGRVKQVTDTQNTDFKDSLPALNFAGDRIAWVREDTSKPIGESGFFETYIMMANFDGTNEEALNPKAGVVQDAPAFPPLERSNEVAWSEFNAETITQSGPTNYGIWIHDFQNKTGRYICEAPALIIGGVAYRCFGQHLVWPVPDTLVLTQQFLELSTTGQPANSVYPQILNGLTSLPGTPKLEPAGIAGFHNAFPISASYRPPLMIFDGLIQALDGNADTLSFFTAQVDGSSVIRFNVADHTADFDAQYTANYLFSTATPQLVP